MTSLLAAFDLVARVCLAAWLVVLVIGAAIVLHDWLRIRRNK